MKYAGPLIRRLPIRPIQVYDLPFARTTFWRDIPQVQTFLSINIRAVEQTVTALRDENEDLRFQVKNGRNSGG
jgi:hypothetical protein